MSQKSYSCRKIFLFFLTFITYKQIKQNNIVILQDSRVNNAKRKKRNMGECEFLWSLTFLFIVLLFICSAGNIKSDTNSYSSIFQQFNTLPKKSWFLKTKSNSFTHKHQLFFSKNQKNNNKLFFFSKRLLFFFFVGKLWDFQVF